MTKTLKGDLLIDSNTVVHCKTEELAKRVLQVAHDLGYAWSDGDSYIENTLFETFQSETAYILYEGYYDEVGIYRHSGCKIISAKRFLKLHGKWEETKPTETPADQIDLTKLPIGTKVYCVYSQEIVTIADIDLDSVDPIEIRVDIHNGTYRTSMCGTSWMGMQPVIAPSKDAFLANPLNPWGTYDFSQHEPIKEEETEESPYNEDGSIKKGWLCEFWDHDQTHSRGIAFYVGVSSDNDYDSYYTDIDGDLIVTCQNCRPIPRSEWADWAVEAHKTLKL